jgi:pyrroloquinoline quinone (PQQ) biosynthesis protein C
MFSSESLDKLNTNVMRHALLKHPFFDLVDSEPLNLDTVSAFLGQWWHPLHFFPEFLGRSIAVVPRLEMKVAVSKVLYQELGEGDASRAHERIYLETMQEAGFSPAAVSGAAALPATAALVEGYRSASAKASDALGFMYATEVADLRMVAGIGRAVRRVTGRPSLRWVDIHVTQEPEHVNRAKAAFNATVSSAVSAEVAAAAEHMWQLWVAFFSALQSEMFVVGGAAPAGRQPRGRPAAVGPEGGVSVSSMSVP